MNAIVPYRGESSFIPMPPLEHRGPREKCPYCSVKETLYSVWVADSVFRAITVLESAKACRGVNWLRRLFGGCKRRDPHIHQRCPVCKGKWVCAPLEEIL